MTTAATTVTERPSAPGAAPARRPALVRNAAALMTSTATSGALTFVFWVVAARWFPADVVGRVSAVAASMALLASLSQLNLVSLYARFLPRAGARTRPLVLAGYGAAVAMSVLLCTGYLAFGGTDGIIDPDPLIWLLFTGTVAASAIFFIQGSVLTALGRAIWVPAVNGATSAARLALLPLLAGFGGMAAVTGILAAWAVPIVASMVLVSWWVIARGAPHHGRTTPTGPPVRPREVLGFASAEYLNGITANVVAFLPPVLVTAMLGTTQGAYFYLPWLFGVSAITLLWNVVTSFVVEASSDLDRARAHVHRAIALIALVVLPGAAVLALGAEPLLRLLGPEYAANGAGALRLIGLALPFAGVVLLYSAFCMMAKRMWRLVAAQGTAAGLLLAGIWFGVPVFGLVAPAGALLLSQAAVAAAVLPAVIRRYRETGSTDRLTHWR